LSLGSGGSWLKIHQRLTCHTSACFRSHTPTTELDVAWCGIRPVIHHPRLEQRACGAGFLWPFDPPAFASWASVTRQGIGPSLRSADRHANSAFRTLSGFPCSACVRPGWGRVPSVPRGRRCPHGRSGSATVVCRFSSAQSLSVRHYHPTRSVLITRHQRGFPFSHPIPAFPLPVAPGRSRDPWAFPRASHPAVTGHARHGGDRSQTQTRSHVIDIGRPPIDGLTCRMRLHVAIALHRCRRWRGWCRTSRSSGSCSRSRRCRA